MPAVERLSVRVARLLGRGVRSSWRSVPRDNGIVSGFGWFFSVSPH